MCPVVEPPAVALVTR